VFEHFLPKFNFSKLIYSHPHSRHHSSHIMASEQNTFEYGRL